LTLSIKFPPVLKMSTLLWGHYGEIDAELALRPALSRGRMRTKETRSLVQAPQSSDAPQKLAPMARMKVQTQRQDVAIEGAQAWAVSVSPPAFHVRGEFLD